MDGHSGQGGTASLAQLCASLQRASDEERRQLARLLHDSVTQTLAAASMNLTLVERSASDLGAAGQAALARAQELVASCCRQLGELSYRLYPLTPGENGLSGALRGLASRAGPARLQVTVPPLADLDPALEQTVYRMVEETLAGAFVDGEAVTARVTSGGGDGLLVTLTGRPRPDPQLGLATLALRQRVRAVGGRLRVRRGSRQASIEARFPTGFPRRP
jgi:two-component system, NarL family, sensor kinase